MQGFVWKCLSIKKKKTKNVKSAVLNLFPYKTHHNSEWYLVSIQLNIFPQRSTGNF